MVISVKRATINDLEAINKMAVETFYETYAWYNTPEDMVAYTQTNFSREKTRKDLEESETIFFMAYALDELVGYAKMRRTATPPGLQTEKHIEIERVYVVQKFQKQKAGYALVKKCVEAAKEQNLEVVWLGVWKKNKKAIAFYERFGFKIFGSQVFRLGNDPQDDHLMKFEL